MMDGNRPPGRETRRTGTPAQSTGPDHRHQLDSTLPPEPEGSWGEVVPFGRPPQRWLAIHSGDGRYVVVADAVSYERPWALGVYDNIDEAERCLNRYRDALKVPVFTPDLASLEPSDDEPVAS